MASDDLPYVETDADGSIVNSDELYGWLRDNGYQCDHRNIVRLLNGLQPMDELTEQDVNDYIEDSANG